MHAAVPYASNERQRISEFGSVPESVLQWYDYDTDDGVNLMESTVSNRNYNVRGTPVTNKSFCTGIKLSTPMNKKA